ncbi:MAG: TatD family hydrolase, partial [Candidatus Eremiobacteraeota bacterium]|nr:TatD family hydrolase [Candidatus Eremiobacteraeota bacterium]
QQHCMRAQIQLARDHRLPLIFHHRDAFTDFVGILEQEWQAGMQGVVHCFTGDRQQAQRYVGDFGLKLGIGGIITFRNAHPIRDALAAVGIEACVLETDCPYLAPAPHRGKRNEPAFINDTARAVAEIVEKSVEEIVNVTDRNARELFRIGSSV